MGVMSFVRKVAKNEISLSEVPIRVLKRVIVELGLPPYSRQYFERLYAQSGDPWLNASSSFEHTKYHRMLDILPRHHFIRILEIGCSVGVFTELLAPHGSDILAVDISEIARRRAAQRCQNHHHLRFAQLDLVTGTMSEEFDLIFCSGVLPFLNDIVHKERICEKIASWMAEDAYLVLVNDLHTAEVWPIPLYVPLKLIEERRFLDYKWRPGPQEAPEMKYVISLFQKVSARGGGQG